MIYRFSMTPQAAVFTLNRMSQNEMVSTPFDVPLQLKLDGLSENKIDKVWLLFSILSYDCDSVVICINND